jgi:hypothetical protein
MSETKLRGATCPPEGDTWHPLRSENVLGERGNAFGGKTNPDAPSALFVRDDANKRKTNKNKTKTCKQTK